MSNRIEIKPGQRWWDKDKRSSGRSVRVEHIDSAGTEATGYALCRHESGLGRRTRIAFETLRARFSLTDPRLAKGGPA